MGTTASVPLNIEAFRPPPRDRKAVAAVSVAAAASSTEIEATAPTSNNVGNGHRHPMVGERGALDVHFPMTLPHPAEGLEPSERRVAGKRSRHAPLSADDGSYSSRTGQDDEEGEEEPPRKLAAWQSQGHALVGAAESECLIGLNTPEADVGGGDNSVQSVAPEAGARAVALGVYSPISRVTVVDNAAAQHSDDHASRTFQAGAAFDAPTTFSTPMNRTSVDSFRPGDGGGRGSSGSIGVRGTNTVSFGTPLRDTAQAVGVVSPTSLFSGGGANLPQLVLERPQLVAGVEGGACSRDGWPYIDFAENIVRPPLLPPSAQPLPEPPHSPVEGFVAGSAPDCGSIVHPSALPLSLRPVESTMLSQPLPTDLLLRGDAVVDGKVLADPHHGVGADVSSSVPFPDIAPCTVPNPQTETPKPKPKKTSVGGCSGGGGGKSRARRRPCGMDGCKRRPLFGVEGTRKAQFCVSHKPDGFVNVVCKQCETDGCKRQPSFGMPGSKPRFCAAHRSEGMFNLLAPRCVSLECQVVPSFASPGARRASACAAHKRDGDVDVVTRRCHQEGCVRRPVFGYASGGENIVGRRQAHYCKAHKLEGMVNVFAARCAAASCGGLATFGPPGVKKPTHCAKHRTHQHERVSSYHS